MTKASHSNRFHGPWLEHWQTSNWCSIIMTRRRTHWLNVILVQRRRSASTFLFFVAAQMLTVGLSVNFFCWANVNSFFMTEPNKDNIIQQLFWADKSRMAVCFSSSAGVSLDTSNQDRREENDPYVGLRSQIVLCDVLNAKFLSRHSCLTAARQSRSHSLTVHVPGVRLVCCCCAVNRCSFWKLIFHKVV